MTLDNPTNEFKEIYLKGYYLLRTVDIQRPIRLLGLTASNLTNDDIVQISLWDFNDLNTPYDK